VDGPQGFWARLLARISRVEVLSRVGLCVGAAAVLLVLLRGWTEPFPFRVGSIPERGLVAVRIRDGLKNRIAEVAAADTLAAVSRMAWLEFAPDAGTALDLLPLPPDPKTAGDPPVAPDPPTAGTEPAPEAKPTSDAAETAKRKLLDDAERAFQRFRGRVDTKEKLQEVEKAVDRAFADTEAKGVLEKIQHGLDDGSQTEIEVHPLGDPAELSRVQVFDVQSRQAKAALRDRLEAELGTGTFADRLFTWVEPRLPGTLEIDREATAAARKQAVEKTPQQFVDYAADAVLAPAGQPLTADGLAIVRREHDEYLRHLPASQRLARALAMFGLCVAMFVLAAFYIHIHHRWVLEDLGHVVTLLALATATVAIALAAAGETWQAEVVPLLLFTMTVALAYDEDLALLLAAQVALLVVVGLGRGLADYVTLAAAAAAMVFWMGRIRSRSKLIYVGLWAGAVAALTCLGDGLLEGRSLVLADGTLDRQLLADAGRVGGWTLLAGFLMTGLLPFIERWFGVLTDLSLLGDRGPRPAGPRRRLLSRRRQDAQARLLRREPGTGEPSRIARARHEHLDHRRPRQGGGGTDPAVQPATADHRSRRRASWHDAGGILLPPGDGAVAGRPARRGGGRAHLPLSRSQAEHPRVGGAHAFRRRRKRQPHADGADAGPDRRPRPRPGDEAAARRAVRRLRADARGAGRRRAEPREEPDGRLPRPGQVSRSAHGVGGGELDGQTAIDSPPAACFRTG